MTKIRTELSGNIQSILVGTAAFACAAALGLENVALGLLGLVGRNAWQDKNHALQCKIDKSITSILQHPEFSTLDEAVINTIFKVNQKKCHLNSRELIPIAQQHQASDVSFGEALASHIHSQFNFPGNTEREQDAVKAMLIDAMTILVQEPVFRDHFNQIALLELLQTAKQSLYAMSAMDARQQRFAS